MTGQQALIALRNRGFKPLHVFVTVVDRPHEHTVYTHPDMAMSLGGHPEIELEPGDNPRTADLRCLAGLRVHLSGLEAKTVKQYYDRILQFHPAELIASANDAKGLLHYRASEQVPA